MAGSIRFPSGLDWSVGSTLFDAAIVAIAEVGELDDGPAFDALRSAGQLGWLVFGDLDEPERSELLSIVQSDACRDQIIKAFADGTVLDAARVGELAGGLQTTAREESKLPKWLVCGRDGVIVIGLTPTAIEAVVGCDPWPLGTARVADTVRYEIFQSPIAVDVELAGAPVTPHDDAVIAVVDDARFVVSGQDVDKAVLTGLANLLAEAHGRAAQTG